jgi:hypothetical protein
MDRRLPRVRTGRQEQPRDAEVEKLDRDGHVRHRSEEDVSRFEVAMHDARAMGRIQRVEHVESDRIGLTESLPSCARAAAAESPLKHSITMKGRFADSPHRARPRCSGDGSVRRLRVLK